LIFRGFVKGQQGDLQGEFADYTAVIKLEGAPKNQVAEALYFRGITKGQQGDVQGKLADLITVIDLGVTTGDTMLNATQAGFTESWRRNDRTAARTVLEKFSITLSQTTTESAREISLRFLRTIASPEMKEGWAVAWEVLSRNSQPEVTEALRIFEPVCAILQGKDRSLLEALPPEQREFVQDVLIRFESKQ
jgi:hypothetical protein